MRSNSSTSASCSVAASSSTGVLCFTENRGPSPGVGTPVGSLPSAGATTATPARLSAWAGASTDCA